MKKVTINGKEYSITDANVQKAIELGILSDINEVIKLGTHVFIPGRDCYYLIGRVLVEGSTKAKTGVYGWVAMSLNTGKALVDPKVFTPATKMAISKDELKQLLGKQAVDIDDIFDSSEHVDD